MDPGLWWLFVVVGIVLITLEIVVSGFILLWFGVAAIVTSLPVYLGASLPVILGTYATVLLLLTVFVRQIILRMFSGKSRKVFTNADSVVGATGVVTEEISFVKGTGRARIGKEVWTAVSEDGKTIPIDSIVVVKRLNGVKVVVRTCDEISIASWCFHLDRIV